MTSPHVGGYPLLLQSWLQRGEKGGLGWGHPYGGQVLLLEEAGPRVPAGD